MKAYYRAHAEEMKERARAYNAAHREELSAKSKQWWAAHREEQAIRAKAYREAHKEELGAKAKARYDAADPEKRRQYQAKYRAANRARRREEQKKWQLRKNYGMTPDDVAQMLAAQDNRCLICDDAFDLQSPASFAIDHDHATGEVRGALCQLCNKALGLLRDDPDLMRRAAEYVESRKGKRLEVVN